MAKKKKRKKNKKSAKKRKKIKKFRKKFKKSKKSKKKNKVKKNKSRNKRKKKFKKNKFEKKPYFSKDGDGNTIIRVSDSWANHAYVNESKYKKKYKLSIKENGSSGISIRYRNVKRRSS